MPHPAALPPHPHDTAPIAPVAVAAEVLAELGGGCCPSVLAMVERLIDRQAVDAGRVRP